jgi:uncharacterized protein YbjT (DUF2867 family)
MDLVVGATGLVGGGIARRLLERGRKVRILVREGTDYRRLTEAGAEPFPGDLKEPETLARACAGVTRVVTTANSAQRVGDDGVDTVERLGNRALVDAAAEAGVEQFVFVSAYGAALDHPSAFLQAKAEAERHLRESGLPWTILAPNIFMDTWIPMLVGLPAWEGRPVTLVGEASRRHTLVAAADVAAFGAAVVDNPDAVDAYIPVGGPEAVSWLDVVAEAERVLGRRLEVRFVAPGEPIPGLPPVIAELAAVFESYDSPMEMTGAWATFGVEPTSLASYLEGLFGEPAPAPADATQSPPPAR